uniref:lysozyme C, milk isozyme-like n=1 Tax=Euleptes europaea TaxID=460621 RepID=UPI0025406DB5|nr:lysozyme C, milk isozyme-like [Euleptes europaea]
MTSQEAAGGFRTPLCPGAPLPRTPGGSEHSSGLLRMTHLILLALLTCLTSVVEGKIFSRCELAQQLKVAGLDGYHGYSLANWICLAFYESHFNTGLVDHQADGSTSNGIFQINSHLWCDDLTHPSPNICDLHCSDLLTSSLNDDITCAMRIVQSAGGMGTW